MGSTRAITITIAKMPMIILCFLGLMSCAPSRRRGKPPPYTNYANASAGGRRPPLGIYTCKNFRMASTEPTTPMSRPAAMNTSRNWGARDRKGSTTSRDRPLDWITARSTSS